MLHIRRGKVKFFLVDKGYGYIVPDEGGPDVWFHVGYFSGVDEIYDGELSLEFERDSTLSDYHRPQEHDPIVYEQWQRPEKRNPMALHWLYPDTLAQAEKMLAIRRGSPDNFFVRVMRFGPEEAMRYRPSVLWKGTNEEFRKKLDAGFPQMHDETYYVEQLEINSKWVRMWHPSGWHPMYKRTA